MFVYIKLGMEVGEGRKRVENKVKRKPTCRDDEIICLIEGIGNNKYFDEQVTKFGNKQKKRKFVERRTHR